MHTIMHALIYARICSCIERCMLHIHDFYIYYGLLHSLYMQLKQVIANFIVIYQTLDCMHQTKYRSMHMCMHVCMHIIQEIEHYVIPSLD